MIPVKLKLTNFTSYGENTPELDFTNFKMAAISGLNGAGKSSLLDSITWCVWGTSRAGDSSDALIRLGQNEMSVEFTFELDSHIYTIKRRRSKKGGGSTALEFWSNSHNLTEGTIKVTQQKITDALHLSFETFTNSAYIRQGHADEFTTKGPTDRKRILADILGLDHYDKLEEKAKEKSKETQTKLTLLEYQLIEIEAELSQKEERQKSLSLAETEAKEAEAEVGIIEKSIKELGSQQNAITSQLKILEDRKLQIDEVKKEINDLKLQIDLKETAKKENMTILDQKEAIEQSNQKLLKLQEEKKQLETKRSELIKLKDQWAEIQKVIISLEERRQNKITVIEVEIKRLQTQNEQLQEEINHLSVNKAICPTCNQPINAEKNKEISEQNQKRIDGNNLKLKEQESALEKCKGFILKEKIEAEKLEEEVKNLEKETLLWSEINSQIFSLEKYADLFIKLQQAETAVKTHIEAILDLQKILVKKQLQIESAEKDLEILSTYQEKFIEFKHQLEAKELLKQELAQKAALLQGKVGEAKQLVSRAEQLEKLNDVKQDEKKKLAKEKEIFEELSLAFGKKGIQAMIIEQAIPEIEDETNKLLDRLTEGRMKIRLDTQKETKTKIMGIDGKKDYSVVETLDIIISDEMGERPYELYSGGETFRVNFAIRLAISKLLTHRAGAKLQFLVIDEGFGTQDAPGRARLVEVLDAIKDDFEKILIITHIEELKEEFPTRIEVSKNATGSSFEIVGAS